MWLQKVDGRQVQIQLTGFMEKHTLVFMKELWALLLSAQQNVSGIPQQFLDEKAEEAKRKKARGASSDLNGPLVAACSGEAAGLCKCEHGNTCASVSHLRCLEVAQSSLPFFVSWQMEEVQLLASIEQKRLDDESLVRGLYVCVPDQGGSMLRLHRVDVSGTPGAACPECLMEIS